MGHNAVGDHIFWSRSVELGRFGISSYTLVRYACKVFMLLGPVLQHIAPKLKQGGTEICAL